MRVCVDCRYVRERPSGIGAYVRALVDRLPSLAPDVRFTLWRHPLAPAPLSRAPNAGEVIAPGTPNEPLSLLSPGLFGPTGGDVFHAPHNVLPYGIRPAAVVTVHDAMWLEAPRLAEGSALLRLFQEPFYRAGILNALGRARRILTVSRASADAIARLRPDTRGRLVVAHLAADAHFSPPEDRAEARARAAALLGTDAPYFLLIGQNAPSKGHAIALRAFADMAHVARAAHAPGVRERLVVIQRLRAGRGLDRLARGLGVREQVSVLPAVPTADLVALLRSATALLQPSLAEGFGLPALEAMAAGCPVIASDIAPLVEVLGGAGLHVPRGEPAPLAAAMRRVAEDAVLREELRARGLERARAFSWDTCAAVTVDAYREAARLGPLRGR